MSPRLALHLLGPPKLEIDGSPITTDRRKALALLAYLAVNRGQHTRDFLSALLWPEYDQAKAFTNLRHILWETQQAIGEGWIIADRETVGLNTEADIWLDVVHFESLINASRTQSDIALRIPLLTDSVTIYRNHFLTGFSLKDAPHFNEWAFAESENLRHQLASALTMLSDDLCTTGQAETAIPHARRLVTLDPLNEAAHRQMMKIYIEAGQHNAALKQYQTCEQILRKELGVDPQPETRALYKQIRKGELKPSQFAKQKEAGALQHNLPLQLSTFIGREKELGEIKDLIVDHRLVTLVGTGGIGKTRLSLKIGEQLIHEYANGIWFVELAALADPALVPQTAAKLFQLAEQAGESLTEKLTRVLRSKNMLLILDNCEHLLDACAQLADALLRNCPNLRILATSRESLGITGEAQYHVPPLEMPNVQQVLEKLLEYESVQLFEERARLVNENFSLTLQNASSIAQICSRLDGIPLAIELAAARVNSLSTEQIASRLDESFNLLTGGSRTTMPRHQTLRASIDWSWNLLSEPEQILLRRLSVFAGGWTLGAAESVCAGGGIESQQILGVMAQLVAKSLVVVKQENGNMGRYHMLEMIHQYVFEKLHTEKEDDLIRDRHLAWMLAWAELIQLEFHGRNQIARFNEADAEQNNIRQAIEWGLRTGQIESSMKVCITLRDFMDGHIPYTETRRWLELGLSQRAGLSKNTLARTFSEAAFVTFRQNDPQQGAVFAQESLKLAEELDDQKILAEALRSAAFVTESNGDFVGAELYFEKASILFRQLDDKDGVLRAIGNLGFNYFYQGKVESAIELLEKHMGLVKEMDNLSQTAWYQFALGIFKVIHGKPESALNHLNTSLPLFCQINDINFIANCLVGFAIVATSIGKPLRAAQLFGAREAIHESIGTDLEPSAQPLYTSVVAQTRAMLDEAAFALAWAEGRAMTIEQAIEYALNT